MIFRPDSDKHNVPDLAERRKRVCYGKYLCQVCELSFFGNRSNHEPSNCPAAISPNKMFALADEDCPHFRYTENLDPYATTMKAVPLKKKGR